MISVDIARHRFQLRAAAVIVRDGFVLLHRLSDDAVWALPGGRVDAGESGAETIVREMAEETGEPIECGDMLCVVENFYEHGERPHHEVGLYFEARLREGSRLLERGVAHAGSEGGVRLEFRWFALAELDHVNLHPACLRRVLRQPDAARRHAVQRE